MRDYWLYLEIIMPFSANCAMTKCAISWLGHQRGTKLSRPSAPLRSRFRKSDQAQLRLRISSLTQYRIAVKKNLTVLGLGQYCKTKSPIRNHPCVHIIQLSPLFHQFVLSIWFSSFFANVPSLFPPPFLTLTHPYRMSERRCRVQWLVLESQVGRRQVWFP